jgi:hypothetical protein
VWKKYDKVQLDAGRMEKLSTRTIAITVPLVASWLKLCPLAIARRYHAICTTRTRRAKGVSAAPTVSHILTKNLILSVDVLRWTLSLGQSQHNGLDRFDFHRSRSDVTPTSRDGEAAE